MSTQASSAAFGTPPERRSRAGFWLAGGVAVLAVILAAALGVTRFIDTLSQPDDYLRVTAATPGVLQVDHPGERIVYTEGARLPLYRLKVQVTAPDGAPVPVYAYGGDLTYDTSGHSGRAVGKFAASFAGPYRVAMAAQDGEIAVGTNLFDDLIGIFVGPLIVLGVGLLLAAALLVGTILARRRSTPQDGGIGIT